MNRLNLLGLTALVASALGTSPATAATRQVCSSGCAYSAIQDAVDAANAGDIIMVLDPIHTEGGIVIGTDLTIAGDPLSPPVIQAASAPGIAVDRVLEIQPNTDVVLQDLVIRHGRPMAGGGGILNAGDLRLLRTEVTSNDGDGGHGGGILSTGPLELVDSLVSGNAADLLGGGIACEGLCALTAVRSTIDGNVVRTVIFSDGGAGLYSQGSVRLESCLVTGNVGVGDPQGLGGGIYAPDGDLLLIDTDVTGNQAGAGAGISSGGTLTVVRGSVSDNTATNTLQSGGGLAIFGSFGVLESTQITGNSTVRDGGGVASWCPNLTIRRSTIAGNSAHDQGGGLYVDTGLTVVEDSLIAGSTSDFGGGAAVNYYARLRIRNSTISGNTADMEGGGLWVAYDQSFLSLSNVTVTGNTADPAAQSGVDGGGLFVEVNGPKQGAVDIRNSIVAGNHDPGPQVFLTAPDCAGPVAVDGWVSLGTTGLSGLGNPACLMSGATPDVGGNQGLLPLADNGGPTKTHALDIGSQNIDTGDPSGCKDESGAWLTHDQRGGSRFNTCDRGAYEVQAALPIFTDDFETGGTWLWSVTAD